MLTRTSLIAWMLAQGANLANVLASVIVAHLASAHDFSRFATLSAALAIMTAALNPLINEIAHHVAQKRLISRSILRSRSYLAASVCLTLSFASCRSITSSSFDALLVYLLIPLALIAQSWSCGILSGLHRMVTLSSVMCLGGALRLIILSSAIGLGYPFKGVTLSYLTSFIAVLLATSYLTKDIIRGRDRNDGGNNKLDSNWVLVSGFLLLALPFSLDQPIIQATNSAIAADYAALMTYAKSVMLLAGPAIALIYSAAVQPSAKIKSSHIKGDIKRIATSLAIASTLAAILWLIHPLLFPLLLGAKYLHVSSELGLALSGMALYVVSYLIIQRLLLSSSWLLCLALGVPVILQSALLVLVSRGSTSLSVLTAVSFITFAVQFVISLSAALFFKVRTY
jgi:hypothetical protein